MIWQLYCCLTSPCLYGRLALNSLHQGIFLLPGQHLEVPSVTSGGSRRRECLKPAKKRALRRPKRCAAQVHACMSTVEPPPPGGKGVPPFPALVPGAGTLPVGFQGRSALGAPRGAKSRILTEGSCALSTTTPIPWSTAARCHRDTGPPIRGRDGRFRRRAAQTAPCDCSGRSRS